MSTKEHYVGEKGQIQIVHEEPFFIIAFRAHGASTIHKVYLTADQFSRIRAQLSIPIRDWPLVKLRRRLLE